MESLNIDLGSRKTDLLLDIRDAMQLTTFKMVPQRFFVVLD